MPTCCFHNTRSKSCVRKQDKKLFKLPRRFTRKRCLQYPVKGYTMRSSCAPYKFCKKSSKRKHRKKTRVDARKVDK